jgi:uncharacterized protein
VIYLTTRNNMLPVFLTAEWRKLAMANYSIDPAVLMPFLPARTELDHWQGETYVSLVGFQFRRLRVRGWYIPFHTRFPEVNLRFYVRYKEGLEWKRGVVFIREIVPLPAVTFIANSLYHERYITLPMRCREARNEDSLALDYRWKYRGHWNQLAVDAAARPSPLIPGSQEEFITEHFWGYSRAGINRSSEYQVAHPRWDIYRVEKWVIDCDFGNLYGQAFAGLAGQTPQSIFLAEGSVVEIYSKRTV